MSEMQSEIEFTLDGAKLNKPASDDLDEVIRKCKQAHFTNIKIRINGEWEEHEADWIKYLVKRGK